MSFPQISIDLDCIERNARAVVDLCQRAGITVFGVTKGACGMPQVARAMLRGGVSGIAESRFGNIRRLREAGLDCPIMLLRSPSLTQVEELVRSVDISLQSEVRVLREVSRAAERVGRVHDVILMIDLGDLRKGVWPNDLMSTVEAVLEMPGIRIAGVGTNLSCFGAIVPTSENLSQLVGYARQVEAVVGYPLDWISGGNSSSLPLLLAGGMPAEVKNLRIGEAILQGGRDTFLTRPWDLLDRDAFELTGELLGIKIKPSLPIGESGVDAFGSVPVFIDEGDRLRGIANIGREDVIWDGLTPTRQGVKVIGASSDHLVLDLTDATPPFHVGETLSFRMNYGALLTAMTSEYVEKIPTRFDRGTPQGKSYSVSADEAGWDFVTAQNISHKIESLGFTLSDGKPGVELLVSRQRRDLLPFLAEVARRHDSLGLIWIDSVASLMPYQNGVAPIEEHSVLRRILTHLPPHIAPENVVVVGLRSAQSDEISALRNFSRTRVFTIEQIDTVGLRQVMRDAIGLAAAGTSGFHVSYSPIATDMPGWAQGVGGITVRETHMAMAMASLSGKLRSLSLADITPDLPDAVRAECAAFVLSAFGRVVLAG